MWGPVVRRPGLGLLRGCRSGRDVLADWTREPGPGRQQECCHLRERLWLICAAALTGRAEAKACRGGRGVAPAHGRTRNAPAEPGSVDGLLTSTVPREPGVTCRNGQL